MMLLSYVKCQNNFVKMKIDKYDKDNKKFIYIVHLKNIGNVPKIEIKNGGTKYLQNRSKIWALKDVIKFIKN